METVMFFYKQFCKKNTTCTARKGSPSRLTDAGGWMASVSLSGAEEGLQPAALAKGLHPVGATLSRLKHDRKAESQRVQAGPSQAVLTSGVV